MFALMVPVIITGAWAERFPMRAAVLFFVLWPCVVYYPLAHWIWNPRGWLMRAGVLDFAGGLAIHTSSGVAALVVSSMVEKRRRFEQGVQGEHSLPLTVIGTALIWAGWYSFNGGSALRAGAQAGSTLLNTQIASCAGAMCRAGQETTVSDRVAWVGWDPGRVSCRHVRRRASWRGGEGALRGGRVESAIAIVCSNIDMDLATSVLHVVMCTLTARRAFLGIEFFRTGKMPTTAFACGTLAGLAAVTPGSGFMNSQCSLAVGIIGGSARPSLPCHAMT